MATYIVCADKNGYVIDLDIHEYLQSVQENEDFTVLTCDTAKTMPPLGSDDTLLVIQHPHIDQKSSEKVHDILYDCDLEDYHQYSDGTTVLVYGKSIDLTQERVYLDLLKRVMHMGSEREDRTGTGTISIFGDQVQFDISTHIPILTTKNVPWRLVIEELLWFMRGDTDSKILESKNVNIWKGNTTREFLDNRGLSHLPEGDIGCGYGFQWRHFGGDYKDCKTYYGLDVGYDQLANVIHQLKTDPFSRRIMMSAWNPKDMHKMALPPCHNQVQFYVTVNAVTQEKQLSCHMYQRSVDTFLGFPWNILSYSVMTYILATMCDMKPHRLVISTGDTHIYKDHIAQVREQLYKRTPLPWPKLYVSPSVRDKSIDDITIDDFQVFGYFSHPSIKAKMSV